MLVLFLKDNSDPLTARIKSRNTWWDPVGTNFCNRNPIVVEVGKAKLSRQRTQAVAWGRGWLAGMKDDKNNLIKVKGTAGVTTTDSTRRRDSPGRSLAKKRRRDEEKKKKE